MSEGEAEPLEEQASRFAGDIDSTLASVLELQGPLVRLLVLEDEGFSVIARDHEGIPLCVKGHVQFRLHLDYVCSWNGSARYLGIRSSTFQLSREGHGEPILRLDFKRDAKNVPTSHYNVHSHHPGLQDAMSSAASGSRARKHPRAQTLHLPTGGRRFRPSLEDFLDFIIRDFRIDASPQWQRPLSAGRDAFKETQLAAAVRDNPQHAAAVLQEMGFNVSWDSDISAMPTAKQQCIQQL